MIPTHWIKLAALVGVASLLLGAGWHYRATVSQRDALQLEVQAQTQTIAQLSAALEIESQAAARALAERAAAQRALEAARRARANDEASRDWGLAPIPPSSKERICAALGSSC
jgi:hypothetical protein